MSAAAETLQVFTDAAVVLLPSLTAFAQLGYLLRDRPALARAVRWLTAVLVVRQVVVVVVQLWRNHERRERVRAVDRVLAGDFSPVSSVPSHFPVVHPLGRAELGGEAWVSNAGGEAVTVRAVPKAALCRDSARALLQVVRSGREHQPRAPLSRVLHAVHDGYAAAVVEEGVPLAAHIALAGPCPTALQPAAAAALGRAVEWCHRNLGAHGTLSADDVVVVGGDPTRLKFRWLHPPPVPQRSTRREWREADDRACEADLYNAGRCLHLLVCGKPPPPPTADGDALQQLADCDPALRGLVGRLLGPPAGRGAAHRQLLEAPQRASRGPPPPVPPRDSSPPRGGH
eukprot:TRINITY_DN70085_c0_g1_i1.p1 TRINITY_DN70085_c0_g1~~TRINITY_DN70085_c0_g1_i1.p1  ORF type:complete len:369 (+),score=83.81 TRINITY_DN70085_c0_g1_i1:80-1108(+)